MYLGSEEVRGRPYAETTQRVIDAEVTQLLREAERLALMLLGEQRLAVAPARQMPVSGVHAYRTRARHSNSGANARPVPIISGRLRRGRT